MVLAMVAVAAAGEGEDDVVAHADAFNVGADFLDNARTFVAEHEGERERHDLLDDGLVRVADAGGDEFDQHFVSGGAGEVDGFDGEFAVDFTRDGGLDLHGLLPDFCF